MDGHREERLTIRIADAAGPLRVSAAEILELEGGPRLAPREALIRVAGDWNDPSRDAILGAISEARHTRHLEPGRAGDVLLGLVELAGHLHRRAQALS